MADGKVTFTLKGGAGYEQPWVVISGDTVEEAVGHLNAATAVLGEIQTAAALFRGAGSAAVLTVPTPTAQATASAVAAGPAPTAPPVSGRVCAHGPRSRKSGTSARGPWVAHFCSLPKGHPETCEPDWER